MTILEELEPLFYPRGVAIIGASQDPRKFGHLCVLSLLSIESNRDIYPINPSVSHLAGLKTYPSLDAVKGQIDLCIIVLPPEGVPSALEDCGNRGIKGAIIITAGFRETGGETGPRLQSEMTRIAERFGIKIIGPNTFGMVNLHAGLNSSFTPLFSSLKKGPVAFISQSGGMCHNFSYMAMDDGLGISKIMSLGNRCNLEFSHMIRYLGEDPQTDVIAMYVEGVDDGRALLLAAHEVALRKPIIAYKAGRSQAGGRAAFSHTGSLAGNYSLYQSAFMQARVITVTDSTALFDGAKALSLCPRPKGNRIAICSVIAGPAVVASDASESEGLVLARFSSETQETLDRVLSPLFMTTNPVDLTSAQSMDIWSEVFHAILGDENTDLLLVVVPKQEFFDPIMGDIVDLLIELSGTYGKPLSFCATFPVNMFAGYKARLEANCIPVYPTPERAARALGYLARYARWQIL